MPTSTTTGKPLKTNITIQDELEKQLILALGNRMIGREYPNVSEIIKISKPYIEAYKDNAVIEATDSVWKWLLFGDGMIVDLRAMKILRGVTKRGDKKIEITLPQELEHLFRFNQPELQTIPNTPENREFKKMVQKAVAKVRAIPKTPVDEILDIHLNEMKAGHSDLLADQLYHLIKKELIADDIEHSFGCKLAKKNYKKPENVCMCNARIENNNRYQQRIKLSELFGIKE